MSYYSDNQPLLGTPYILSQSTGGGTASSSSSYLSSSPSPSTTRTQITPSLCSNLNAFKALLKDSRSLDDSIILRLNRADALSRSTSKGGVGRIDCSVFWEELTTRWKERAEVLAFCEEVVDRKAKGVQVIDDSPELDTGLRVENRLSRDRGSLGRGDTEAQVKRRLIHSEITAIEPIIRARSLQIFASRCPDHPQTPPIAPLPVVGEEKDRARRGRDPKDGVRWNG